MGSNKLIDETGNRHGRLTVLGVSANRKRGKPVWRCQCVCGGIIDAVGTELRKGQVRSCGCARGHHLNKVSFYGRKNPLDKIDDDII
jgi:hypothetical protein